ncbi:MAG: hypothetical protein HeimC2_21860 [Candidatus Heimdallarchaeota archaeon LC_2]|nr:MAG: hypothetical protein HeimC2_21860 [Candidatus Heimdallarchaeota archaeon LC_2]
MDSDPNSLRLYNIYKADKRRIDPRFIGQNTSSSPQDRKVVKALQQAKSGEISNQLALYSNSDNQEFYNHLRYVERSNDGTLVGFISRINKLKFYLRPSLLNYEGGVLLDGFLGTKPLPRENTKVAIDVVNQRYMDHSRRSKPLIKSHFKAQDWRYIPKNIVKLPFKYTEFQELYWDAIDTDFNLSSLNDMKLFEDIYFSNIISSPAITQKGLGGIITSFTYNPIGQNPVTKLIKKMKSVIPNFGYQITVGNKKLSLETYTTRYESNLKTLNSIHKQRTSSRKNVELNISASQSINNIRFKESDLTIPIVSNFSINSRYNYNVLSDVYEYLIGSLYVHPEQTWSANDKIEISTDLIETAEDEILPTTRTQLGHLFNGNILDNQLTRVALNISRKKGEQKSSKQTLRLAKNTIINNVLELANHVKKDQFFHSGYQVNISKPIERDIVQEFLNIYNSHGKVEKNTLLTNLVNLTNKSLMAYEMALEHLIVNSVFREIREEGSSFLILMT